MKHTNSYRSLADFKADTDEHGWPSFRKVGGWYLGWDRQLHGAEGGGGRGIGTKWGTPEIGVSREIEVSLWKVCLTKKQVGHSPHSMELWPVSV